MSVDQDLMNALSAKLRQSSGIGVTVLPAHAWILGIVIDSDGKSISALPPTWREPYGTALASADPHPWAECTCPDECLADHENE